MPLQLLVLDLDGTVLDDEKRVSVRNRQEVAAWKAAGRLVALATARPPRFIEDIVDALGGVDYWVCYNGATVDSPRRRLLESTLEPAACLPVLRELARRFPDTVFSLEQGNRLYCNRAPSGIFGQIDWDPIDYDQVSAGPGIAKILSAADPGVQDFLDSTGLGTTVASDKDRIVQLGPAGITKGAGVQCILDVEGLEWAQVLAFGDDTNDIDIISRAGLGIAMGNADPRLKSVADRIAPTNIQDGVAAILEEFRPYAPSGKIPN